MNYAMNVQVTNHLTTTDLLEAADACQILAELDEGEHTDHDRLLTLAQALRKEAATTR